MWLLYRSEFKRRWTDVCGLLRDDEQNVLELCFGDVAVAEYCRSHGKAWTGLDVSEAFVAHARRKRFDARRWNVAQDRTLPRCDVCVMMGSLYHFSDDLVGLFRRIRAAAPRVIVSEPVRNWTHAKGWPAFLARKLTRAGRREETFRFDERSLRTALETLKNELGFSYRIVSASRDMVVEVVWST
jgi:hypothetical protein